MEDLDDFLYLSLNSKPDWTAESRLHASIYGEYEVEEGKMWTGKYNNLTG